MKVYQRLFLLPSKASKPDRLCQANPILAIGLEKYQFSTSMHHIQRHCENFMLMTILTTNRLPIGNCLHRTMRMKRLILSGVLNAQNYWVCRLIAQEHLLQTTPPDDRNPNQEKAKVLLNIAANEYDTVRNAWEVWRPRRVRQPKRNVSKESKE